MSSPEQLDEHGRAWRCDELARKAWDDLWRIWWVCLRERNWLSTETTERKRVEAGYGDFEGGERDQVVS